MQLRPASARVDSEALVPVALFMIAPGGTHVLPRLIGGPLIIRDESSTNSRQAEKGSRGDRLIRVLHVNKQYSPWIGGVEAVVQEICEAMNQSSDVRCEVLACQDRGPRAGGEVNGVHVTRVASLGTALGMPIAISYPFELERVISDFDIVHIHLPFPAVFFADWRRIKRRGCYVVIHYHADVVRPVQRAILKLLAGLQRRLFEAADRIIVTSSGLLNNSDTLAPYREKCEVVPLSINLESITQHTQSQQDALGAKFDVNRARPVVLTVGRLVYYKGLQFLIDAVKTLDVSLVIAGDGPLRKELERQIHSIGLADRVTLVGRVSDEDLSCLYSLADLFVLPSVESSEAFGLVQLEAMARGIPVINTNLRTGVPSVSLDESTGLTVEPRNPEQLRAAISRILQDRQLHERFSQHARERVHQFSRPVVLEKIRAVYRSLVAGKGGSEARAMDSD